VEFQKIYSYAVLTVAIIACDGPSNRHPVPYVFLNETVFLNSPSAFDLQFVGGTYLRNDWGHGGLVVYRRTNFGEANDFGAYDLRCPNHPSLPCGASTLKDGLYAECGCDGQRFLLFDGSATSGQATWGLLPYLVQFDGVSLQLSNL
jgi:nitrite reductase/ring-hydroxylating ferredoxin subunit